MIRRIPLHPLLFALYPIVFLIARNLQGQVSFGSALVPALVTVGATVLVVLALWPLLKSLRKAAVVASVYVLLFFSYGHVRDAVLGSGGSNSDPVQLVAWLGLAVLATVLIARTKSSFGSPTLILNVLAGALVLMNLVPVAVAAQATLEQEPAAPSGDLKLPADPEITPGGKRDIYYIIFDRYANEATLSEQYGFDNSEVLGFLESRGFFVAHDSAANYPRTGHSVASSLNMTYLTYLERQEGASSSDWGAIHDLLQDAELTRYLKSLGYRYHHIGSWWNPTAETSKADVNHVFGAPSEFSSVLLRSTMWPAISEELGLEESFGRRAGERRRVAFQLERLLSVKDDPAPTFTLAHFLIPHPPFVLDRNGGLVTEEMAAERGPRLSYLEQLLYTNRVIEKIVDELVVGEGAEDPIIVIQSDEGPHPPRLNKLERSFNWFEATDAELRKKLLILNAYYFPDGHDDRLYGTISPVNTFRVMLKEYFGADLELLADRIFLYRDFHHPYDFREITGRFPR